MCDQRWQLRQQKYTNIEAEPEYRQTNREVGKKTKEAKERSTGEQCKNIKKKTTAGNSKEANDTLTETQMHNSTVTDDRIGNVLTKIIVSLNLWT